MLSRKLPNTLFAGLVCLALLLSSAGQAKADSPHYEKVYRVQIEYWFWPPDIYYWSTYIETTDSSDAHLAFGLLELARDGGYLPAVVGSNDLHIPVDVRMQIHYRKKPRLTLQHPDLIWKPDHSDLILPVRE